MKSDTPSVTANHLATLSPFNVPVLDPLKRARDRVAILGTGHRGAAPFEHEEWELWCLNNMYALDRRGRFRADRWFELHPRAVADDDRVVTACRAAVCYVVDGAEWPEVTRPTGPGEVCNFPLALATGRFRSYFASTFSYEVALAIALGVKEIGLWGCELFWGREGRVEKASLEYWLGIAEALGITVTLPSECWLLRHPALYGLDYWKELEWVGRMVAESKRSMRCRPERPPGPRPRESYVYEREAREEIPLPSLADRVREWWATR